MHLQVEPMQHYTLFPPKPAVTQTHSTASTDFTKISFGPYRRASPKSHSSFEPFVPSPSPGPGLVDSSAPVIPQLAEFASSMIYLMWHARKYCVSPPFSPQDRTSPRQCSVTSITASPAFKRFCFQVLNATQLSDSAVCVALRYVAILLQANPTIEGAEGSEYRLFIVSLMLANKFLDDNTYTNKTWSEISGMKVNDLNAMEAEFLGALDYNLFVRDTEFFRWRKILEACRERASVMAFEAPLQRQQLIMASLESLGLCPGEQKPVNDGYWQYHLREQEQRRQWSFEGSSQETKQPRVDEENIREIEEQKRRAHQQKWVEDRKRRIHKQLQFDDRRRKAQQQQQLEDRLRKAEQQLEDQRKKQQLRQVEERLRRAQQQLEERRKLQQELEDQLRKTQQRQTLEQQLRSIMQENRERSLDQHRYSENEKFPFDKQSYSRESRPGTLRGASTSANRFSLASLENAMFEDQKGTHCSVSLSPPKDMALSKDLRLPPLIHPSPVPNHGHQRFLGADLLTSLRTSSSGYNAWNTIGNGTQFFDRCQGIGLQSTHPFDRYQQSLPIWQN
ncbi:uncharacterized protein BYT42DRAFT_612960 [Radiomyces spectabilis]|uniref:uncharacterized protein n=1 Tax=Radiomyces spectabilis TaxID=64574 RepID=UPI0022210BE1|nr:uncharacterized protein BYT42DRAFT_612960 [Radiomyces spectabilis]KAI8381152.1 hypothetical protein BYT42DRAFT_612960 [Radiomyces spectabilis]